MKHNIDNLSTKVKEACDTLVKAGDVNGATEEDWEAFKQTMDEQLARSEAYTAELKNDIASFVNKG